jgi:phosphoglycolate phosphatase-like HAD superfamily hydrolase
MEETIISTRKGINSNDYYINWPNSYYNKDLATTADLIYNYASAGSVIIMNLDKLYNSILFEDPQSVCQLQEMSYQYDGNEIFILPPNPEIVTLLEKLKQIGVKIIILSRRPQESKASAIVNLNMFKIPYDEIYIDDDKCILYH